MGRNKHKRKNNHVVIVTSDATDAGAKQFRIRPWMMQTIIIILCVIIGALIGYFIYEEDIWEERLRESAVRNGTISALEQEKAELEVQLTDKDKQLTELYGQIDILQGDVAGLNEQINALNDTVVQKEQAANDLMLELAKQFIPTMFPLTSGRAAEEPSEGEEPISVFSVAEGSMVVATAAGTVMFVNEDPDYGNNIWVDHGNGYTTIYRCRGDVKVKKGETVTQGATLLLITEQGSKLGYQIMKDNVYVEPMDMLDISG
ncbi:MAG: peptidoglycan DD-metalloendopeptidase family protein [Lachnospiraceae bacterium]|nr:peptidoglycan DD-metalloendopeptidase family protein [Lachnospiraceae bacterium]